MKGKLLAILSVVLLAGCSSWKTAMKSSSDISIEWDDASARRIADGGYARIIKLANGHYLAVFEAGGIVAMECADGENWSPKRTIIPNRTATKSGQSTILNACNAEIIELSDGTLVAGTNYRPSQGGVAPYSIAIARSTDHGASFSDPITIYEAGLTFADGCWEPAFLELPDGTLQCYFANEGPYTTSKEQEISMLSSYDKGLTWTKEPVTVCFRAHCRDGMPVPRIIGDEIVVAIEDNGRGELQPATVRCKLADNWEHPVYADDPCRDFAFPSDLYPGTYQGAPYLLQLPCGATLISYQTCAGRSSEWYLSCMEVAVGDAHARNFKSPSRPFDVPPSSAAMWNSIMLWDDATVMAISSMNGGIWIKKGHISKK